MLPVLEDHGLAGHVSTQPVSVYELLLHSSVCGCGLDCVPVPGTVAPSALQHLYIDLAMMAFKVGVYTAHAIRKWERREKQSDRERETSRE